MPGRPAAAAESTSEDCSSEDEAPPNKKPKAGLSLEPTAAQLHALGIPYFHDKLWSSVVLSIDGTLSDVEVKYFLKE